MRKIVIAACAMGLMSTTAIAGDDFEAYCNAEADDPSGCECLAGEADEAMIEELTSIEGDLVLEELAQATQDAIRKCWPGAGEES